jgi:hypothetical protein
MEMKTGAGVSDKRKLLQEMSDRLAVENVAANKPFRHDLPAPAVERKPVTPVSPYNRDQPRNSEGYHKWKIMEWAHNNAHNKVDDKDFNYKEIEARPEQLRLTHKRLYRPESYRPSTERSKNDVHPRGVRTPDDIVHIIDGHIRADDAVKENKPIKVKVVDYDVERNPKKLYDTR